MKNKLLSVIAVLGFCSGVYPAHSNANFPSDSTSIGFEFNNGTYTTIPVPSSNYDSPVQFPSGIAFPGSTQTTPTAINSSGQIVGIYYTGPCPGCGPEHGFLYSGGIYSNIDVPGASWGTPGSGTFPFAISIAGQIAGSYYTGSSACCDSNHPSLLGFIFSNSQYTSIQAPGSYYTNIQYINSSEDVVGYNSSLSWFLYANDEFTFLNPPVPSGFYLSRLTVASLGEAGEVFGYYSITAVPESSTWAMLLIGFAGIGFIGYRGRKDATLRGADIA